MGTDIQSEHFTESDRAHFKQRLDRGLRALDLVLARPNFSVQPRSLGVELELCCVDAHGRALGIGEHVVREADTPAVTPEMGVFDIELTTPPAPLSGTPFSALREHMQASVRRVAALAARHGGRVVPIGILPTLRREDFHVGAITNLPRYRALAQGLRRARGTAFEIAIEGEDSLHFHSDDAVAMEAANSAFQIHVDTRPDEFRDLFNAALLLSGPTIAAAANSPTFLGCRLWHETRVALFKQAGDDRPPTPDADGLLPPRVNFGNGWVHEGAHELFVESVALYPPLLAECGDEDDPERIAQGGQLPSLSELRLHHGTVWSWNRPVYDPEHGGSLRIELRILPAGPSYDDMLANAAFLVGAMLGLKERMPELTAALPFALARQNFERAAQHGLAAELAWPLKAKSAPSTIRARDILLALTPCAREGLQQAGVQRDELERFLSVFEARVRSGQTGAVWQRSVLAGLVARGMSAEAASEALVQRYLEGFQSQRPVHLWPVEPDQSDGGEAPHV